MATFSPEVLEFTEKNGLVIVGREDTIQNNHERLFLHQIKDLNPRSAFFRRYFRAEEKTDENPKAYRSEPAVIIFSEDDVKDDRQDEIHRALWSSGLVDIYIIKGKTHVQIFNCRKRKGIDLPNQIKFGNAWEDLRLAKIAIDKEDDERFHPRLFGTGTFWEQTENQNIISEKDTPYITLLEYLMHARKGMLNDQKLKLSRYIIDQLLVTSILIKFLEEIKDENDTNTLYQIYTDLDIPDFETAISKNLIFKVLDRLSEIFNGKIFNRFEPDEKDEILKADLKLISKFLKADEDLEKGQLFIWKQFNFKHLPTEVISAIYENFVQYDAKEKDGKNEKGVVYTPIFLVDFLVDEAMPLDKPELLVEGKFSVLDPTCGSGVFLVAAYKRLLQWWTIQNSPKDGVIKYPPKDVAQKLLEDNIFGVDVKKEAVLVSAFGLTTTFLNHLTPTEVWNDLKFKDLGVENLTNPKTVSGFFEWAASAKRANKCFDLIIGNPPFNVETGKDKKAVLKPEYLEAIGVSKDIPNENFALHFFEASMQIAEKVCMILPSNAILYSHGIKTKKYRKGFFTNYTVSDIWDFTHLRESLFIKKAIKGTPNKKKIGRTPVVALLAIPKPTQQKSIVHTIIKRTQSSEKKIRFEIDHYDQHTVPWNWAVAEDKYFVWKTNLLGGGGLFHLIYRFSLLPTVGSEIRRNHWKGKRGFDAGNVEVRNAKMVEAISSDGKPKIVSVSVLKMKKNDKEFYKPPYLVRSLKISSDKATSTLVKPTADYEDDEPIYFKRDYIGIKTKSLETVQKINNYLDRGSWEEILNPDFYMVCLSSTCLVDMETTIREADFLSLPFPSTEKLIEVTKTENWLQEDVLKYYLHLGKQISPKSQGSKLLKVVDPLFLQGYSKTLCIFLNEIYEVNQNSWQPGKTYFGPDFTVCQIGYGATGKMKPGLLSGIEGDLKSLIVNEYQNQGAIFKRVITLYTHENGFDCIYLIKPNTIRYWLKSIALRDSADLFIELRKNGF